MTLRKQAARLARRKPLQRGGPIARRCSIRRISKKRRAELPAYRQVKAVVRARSGGRCEAGMDGCTGQAEHPHHRLPRGDGGKDTLENLLDVCAWCHDQIHFHNQAEAIRRGLLLRSYQQPQ